MKEHLILGTRRSKLARIQTDIVRDALQAAWPSLTFSIIPIDTQGDRGQSQNIPLPPTGLKGMFTAELEDQLRDGRIDIAVHSVKDLPAVMEDDFELGAILQREHPLDVLVSASGCSLADLPPGSIVGTSSTRRAAQILGLRPDLKLVSIRGNVETRLRKLETEPYDAIVLAHAGLERMELSHVITEIFPAEIMLPAPGQGALAVQCRRGDSKVLELLSVVDEPYVRGQVIAERAFVEVLEATCNTPVAAYATVLPGGELELTGRVFRENGTGRREITARGSLESAYNVGQKLGERALTEGFGEILAEASARAAH
jgi:hydroxymethylbilane synthase